MRSFCSCTLLVVFAGVSCLPVSAGPSIIFSEVMFNPKDISDRLGEWIEFYNPLDHFVDLSGFTLADQSGKSFSFDTGTVMGAGDILIITKSAAALGQSGLPIVPSYFDFSLNNSGDALLLQDNSGSILDTVAWGGAMPGWDLHGPEGQSLQRVSLLANATGWNIGLMPTPGQFSIPGVVPEPATLILLGLGLGVVKMGRRMLRV